MDDFKFLNYHTEYKCEGTIDKEFGKEACFGKIFRCDHDYLEEKYLIRLYKKDHILKTQKNNSCFVGRKEIKRHLKIISSLLVFDKYEFEVEEKENYFDVTLEIKADRLYHQYILTWLRYLYEFPFNMILKDAKRMRKEKEFKFESLSNLFVVISNCYTDIFDREIHLISWGSSRLLSNKQISERMKNLISEGDRKLNHIYKNQQGKEIIKGSLYDLKFWESEEKYNERLVEYKKSYKKCKK